MFTRSNTEPTPSAMDALMARCYAEDVSPADDLGPIKSQLAKNNNLPDVTAAHVDAFLNARAAGAMLSALGNKIALLVRVHEDDLPEMADECELTIGRCVRDLMWAEQMGIYTAINHDWQHAYAAPLLQWVRGLRDLTPGGDGYVVLPDFNALGLRMAVGDAQEARAKQAAGSAGG